MSTTLPSSQSPLEFSPRSSSVSFDELKDEAELDLEILINLYNECFLSLKDLVTANQALHKENIEIAKENLEIAFLIDDLEKGIESPEVTVSSSEEVKSGSSSVSGLGSRSGSDMPKSISIRSSGFLAKNPPPGGALRIRLPASPVLNQGEKEEEVEVDVYNQGMTKTELCNKWGKTGICPYNKSCQFAHGVEELRLVIHHPRYKTQLCRMISADGGCPYGHRCHFRHALP